MVITLLTDFGEGSPYVAQMKGVILGIHPRVRIVDLTHSISPQRVDQAARVLDQAKDAFAEGTCHVAVVDPGVGTNRKILLARLASQFFIAPDNGLLSLVARRCSPDFVYAITQQRYWRSPVSATFHGRDIMAPVAAHLGLGVTPDDLGVPADEYVSLDWKPPRVEARRIHGSVAMIDSFGNLISDIEQELLAEVPLERVRCRLGQRTVQGVVRTYGQGAEGSLIALIGSSGTLELAIVNGNAERSLGARPGDRLSLEW